MQSRNISIKIFSRLRHDKSNHSNSAKKNDKQRIGTNQNEQRQDIAALRTDLREARPWAAPPSRYANDSLNVSKSQWEGEKNILDGDHNKGMEGVDTGHKKRLSHPGAFSTAWRATDHVHETWWKQSIWQEMLPWEHCWTLCKIPWRKMEEESGGKKTVENFQACWRKRIWNQHHYWCIYHISM